MSLTHVFEHDSLCELVMLFKYMSELRGFHPGTHKDTSKQQCSNVNFNFSFNFSFSLFCMKDPDNVRSFHDNQNKPSCFLYSWTGRSNWLRKEDHEFYISKTILVFFFSPIVTFITCSLKITQFSRNINVACLVSATILNLTILNKNHLHY